MKQNPSGWCCMVGISLRSQHIHVCCSSPAVAAWARSSKVYIVTGHVTGVARVVTSGVLRQSWHWLCLHMQNKAALWLGFTARHYSWCFLSQIVSPPNPLDASMALSTCTILPAWLQTKTSMRTAVLSFMQSTWFWSAVRFPFFVEKKLYENCLPSSNGYRKVIRAIG